MKENNLDTITISETVDHLRSLYFNKFYIDGAEHSNSSDSVTTMDKALIDRLKDKTCAIVTGSPSLMDYNYGELIDKHDYIIRSNQSPHEGYEKFVGSRTDIRIINSHYFTALKGTFPPSHPAFIPNMKKEYPMFDENFLRKRKNEILWVKCHVNKNNFSNEILEIQNNDNIVSFVNDYFYNYASNLVGNNATNGYITTLLAIRYFKKVSLFGFSFYEELENKFQKDIYYFMPWIRPANWTNCHNNNNEGFFIKQLAKSGFVQIHKN